MLSQRGPLKIVFLDKKEVYKTKFEGDPIEFQKLIMALISNPYFPPGLRKTVQSDGLDSFNLIDLEKKEAHHEIPKNDVGHKIVDAYFYSQRLHV